jgi:hypothetical protein
MTQHIFSFESELQNNQPEVAPSSPNFSLSVSEKLARYGVNALSEQPLGFGHCEAAVVFESSCPNNTLPILWAASRDWTPLFPRF